MTFFFVLGLMFIYQNFSLGPWVYLALHGTYGFLWLIKDRLYPDKQWEQEVPWPIGIAGFFVVGLYWIAPFLLISNRVEPPLVLVAIAANLITPEATQVYQKTESNSGGSRSLLDRLPERSTQRQVLETQDLEYCRGALDYSSRLAWLPLEYHLQ